MEPTRKPEADFFTILHFFLGKWKTIAAGAFLSAVIGVVYALTSTPVYEATAVISTRDNQAGGGAPAILTQLGGLGGAMASQFGMLNANLDKMELLIKGRDMAKRVIETHDLLPRLYPDQYDAKEKKWKGGQPPNLRRATEALRSGGLKITVDARKKMLRLSTFAADSTLAADLATYYLESLNSKIQDDTRTDAESNRMYLEKQLYSTQDPLLRERINNMVAGEIEKYMLVSAKAFDVLEKPAVPMARLRPKRSQIVVVSTMIGVILTCAGLISLKSNRERLAKR